MRPRLSLPGYEVEVLIGNGPAGEVWRARDLTSGEAVALQRLDEPLDPGTLEVVRHNVRLLRAVRSAHLVRVREVLDDVLVLDHASGGSLERLLARRRLSPGEVVTVVAPVAAALGAAHALGLVHGAISVRSVRFSAEGMPLLRGLEGAPLAPDSAGRRGVAGRGAAADPFAARDVWALAALCQHALTGAPPGPAHDGGAAGRALLGVLAPSAPAALVAAVEAVLSAPAEQRPGAAEFATMLRRACAAAPLRLPADGLWAPPTAVPRTRTAPPWDPRRCEAPSRAPRTPGQPRHARRSRWPRQRLRQPLRPRPDWPRAAVVPVVVLALGVALVGWATGRAAPLAAPAVLPPTTGGVGGAERGAGGSADRWPVVLDRLDAAREEAFAQGDPLRLGAVWVPGSPGMAADTAALHRLSAQGATAHGVRHRVRAVEVDPSASAGSIVRLAVVDELGEQEIRPSTGGVRRLPGRGPRRWVVELVDTPSGWRLGTVQAGAPDPAVSPG